MKDHRPFPSPSAAPAAVRTAPEADDRLVPASSFQERIWLAERLEPDRPLYNVPMAWRLRGRADRSRSEPDRLEPDRLARALAALVERHEILRTRFVQRDGRLWQVVEPPWEPDVEWEDLRGLDDPERDRRLRSRLREVSHRRFDPASGRLLAVALFDLRDGEQALAVCIHHLVWDEGSTAVFLRDLAACYEAAGSEAARPREAVDEPARRGTRDDTARYPASPHQERMEFTDRFESGGVYPHAPLYHNLPLLLRLEEAPDPERLDAALERVEARHEALRTTVALTDRGVAQTVGPPSGTGAAWLDPEPAPGGLEPPPGLDEWLRKPFDLARGPLFRAAVQPDRSGRSGADGGAWLALVGHLAVVDRISLEVVAEELLTLLGAPDRTPAEADLPAGSRYGRWWSDRDHHLLARDVERVAERFAGKIEHSQGAGIAPLHLPQSRPRPAVHLYEEGAVELRLGPEVGLEPLARATDAGEEAVLLAGFAVLLALYSGQDELAIGTPFAARGRSEERLVGPVANLLPVPLRLSPGETFRALAGEVAAELAELRRHGRAPFDDVVRRIDPDKDMSRTPLFDVLFQCVDSPRTVAGARAVELGTGYGKYDLHLFVRRAAGGRSVRLLYNRLLFDHTRMRTLLDHYGRVLEQVAADPARTLARIDPLRPWERHAQRVEWNDTAASYPRTTVVELLREQARTRPDAVALTHDGSPAAVGGPAVVTYGALVRRAAEAAAGLVARGLRPGERVALRFERGIPQVEAILAVLFAGGSYVPVDPDSPDERIRFLLEDSGARFVVTDAAASTASTAATVLTSADLRRPGPAPSGSGLPVPPPEGLAYCIYTSGTTGRPKGVLVTHENLVRLIVNDRFPFAIGPDDVWTLFHSYAFDFSVWELFCCLARGGRAVVVDRDVARDAGRFRRLLPRERVSVLNQTPSAFAALMRAAGDGDEEEGEGHDRTFRSLRYLIFGGEALDPSTLARWHARHPWVRPVNMYGITEITVHATVQPLGMADMASGETASDASVIGRPIPTTTVSLLDVRGTGRLPPVGAVGEIHVGGAAVTRGYLDRPALEAARFVPAPDGAATLDGARRLFRSGDLARYRPDGTLEFLGRADDQVKIRGYRIEPGEIESRLREHPAVAEAAVLLETEPERALVAYVHPVAEPPPAAALRAHLARTLPEYMIPAGFRAVGTIPLTVNGKLDTRALRSLGRRLEDAPEGRPPATGTARALAELWSELLDAPSPGADDSFFELGGHSVLGARLVARIAERFGVELPLRHLFEHPRLQELADRIDAARASAGPEGGDPGGAAVGAGTEELLPASGFQQRLWLAERADPGGAVYTVPTVWRIRGRLDPEILRRALARVTGRHEILRTRFVERSGALHQAIGAPWTPELEREDLRGAGAGATRERLEERLRREAERRFDPASGRLFHAALVDLDGPGGRGGRDAPGGAEQALFLCFHHLVWDAGSAVPFLRDLARCYDAEARSDVGSDATLPPPGPQYRDFVRARRRRRESGGLTEGLEHWAEALRGAPSALPLPLPAEPEPDGAVALELPPDLLERLRPLQVERGVSWFMVAATALAAVLHRATGADDLTFGCPFSDREGEELEPVIGPCLNTVILRSRIDSDPGPGPDRGTTLGALMGSLRDATLDALEHRDVPFEDVVQRLAPERRPGRTPFAEAVLNVHVAPPAWPEIGGRTVGTLPLRSQWEYDTKFGLTVTLLEEGGRLDGVVSYRGDRVSRRRAEDLARRLEELLARFGRLLERPLGDLDGALAPAAPEPSSRPDRPPQYRELVAAQIARSESPARAAGLEHWVRKLEGAPPYLPFPKPRTRSGRPEPSGGVEIPLDGAGGDLLERLRPVQGRYGVSWPMIAATALAALLHRWTAQDDVTFGAPVARRDGAMAEVLGPCLNTVVLRSRCPEGTTLGELLERTKREMLDALEHQDVPFEAVIERLNPSRRPGWSPYIDVTLALDAAPERPPRLGGVELEELPLEHRAAEYLAKFGLTVGLTQVGGRLQGLLGYRGDRFGRADAEQLARLLGRILERFPDSLDVPVGALDLVDDAERERLRRIERGAPAGPPTSVPALLAEQVRARPEAPAVESDRGVLTYRELDRRARALAARLRPLAHGERDEPDGPDGEADTPGAGDDRPIVALALGRGEDLIVAMLAAWKAGCAFCPIDLGYPEARVELMLRDLDARAVVTRDAAMTRWLAETDVPVVEPGGDPRGNPGPDPGPDGPPPPDPESLAYVIYTSGSTGEPKGVPIRHRNLAHYVRWHVAAFDLDPGDRCSLVSSVGFDLSQCEIWCTLCAGACVIPYERPAVVATELAPWVEAREVTLCYAPTVLAEALWATGARLGGVRWLYFAGSALTRRPPAGVGYRLCNAYGPTETTIIVSAHEIAPEEDAPVNCIGRPIRGARLHVVDAAGRRCPRGVPGEILIGGAGVAGRYWRRPELSRERFLTRDPDGALEPVYRTGDLGRWSVAGEAGQSRLEGRLDSRLESRLEFLGRLDRQVKIRGYRVEPQEIEVHLQEDPLVARAVVMPVDGESPTLAAYAVPAPDAPRDTRAVLDRLTARLPDFMIPSALVWLDALPTTAHGKLDAARLPRPGRSDVLGAGPRAAPEGELERRIAAVWSSVLRLDEVGVHDNFFDLGGHSILLSTLHARLEGELGRTLPIEMLFEYPTVAALSRALSEPEDLDGPDEEPDPIRERAARGRRARRARPSRGGGGRAG